MPTSQKNSKKFEKPFKGGIIWINGKGEQYENHTGRRSGDNEVPASAFMRYGMVFDEIKGERLMITTLMKMAVIALNEGKRVADVAILCKTSTAQIKKWTEMPEFKKERYLDMTERFGSLAGEALETLRQVMNDKDARGADRIKASTEILNRAGFIVQQSVNFTITDTERSGEFKMSVEELQSMRDDVKRLLDVRDITPEAQFQIAEDCELERLEEEVEGMDGH